MNKTHSAAFTLYESNEHSRERLPRSPPRRCAGWQQHRTSAWSGRASGIGRSADVGSGRMNPSLATSSRYVMLQ
ncbi:hypothetical protein [Acidithrix ferrooxidans]|uniref:hypothetical protein n=1 Tax=Acidithrix ferrooxidans TaxID=1280514 RepID=UPI001269CB36|nr:hypothetical protein [Acidithrix ferrooxidans]